MSTAERIIDLIDDGLQSSAELSYGDDVEGTCVRDGCREPAAGGGNFCGECRAFMLEDTDIDPVAERRNDVRLSPSSGWLGESSWETIRLSDDESLANTILAAIVGIDVETLERSIQDFNRTLAPSNRLAFFDEPGRPLSGFNLCGHEPYFEVAEVAGLTEQVCQADTMEFRANSPLSVQVQGQRVMVPATLPDPFGYAVSMLAGQHPPTLAPPAGRAWSMQVTQTAIDCERNILEYTAIWEAVPHCGYGEQTCTCDTAPCHCQ